VIQTDMVDGDENKRKAFDLLFVPWHLDFYDIITYYELSSEKLCPMGKYQLTRIECLVRGPCCQLLLM
jgi:hypothetical protein